MNWGGVGSYANIVLYYCDEKFNMYHHLLSQTMGSDVHLYTKNEHTAQQDYFSFQVKDRHREGTSGFPGTSN